MNSGRPRDARTEGHGRRARCRANIGRSLLFALLFLAALCPAQWRSRRNSEGPIYYTEGGDAVDVRTVRTAREIASHSTGTPEWKNPPEFSRDVFTFVRIIRDRDPGGAYSAGSWITDFPDSDLNLSFRLQQMTSMKVDPNGRIMRLTDKELFDYPFIYMVEPGALLLRDDEVPILRKYLLNGGFFMADDFWGEWQWECFAEQIKRVFPDRDFVELPMEHPIFRCVFPLKGPKNSLQTPNERQGVRSQFDGVTWERHIQKDGSYEDCTEMHVRALLDDKGRIMIIATHNCDNGDAWEREGESDYFFHEFSEKRGFPLGINIIFYAMTH
jgi:uncharacterized protein DUF4159